MKRMWEVSARLNALSRRVLSKAPSKGFAQLRYIFDAEYYRTAYLNDCVDSHTDPFEHYLREGVRKAYSPNAWFDEEWYCAFYYDVRKAVIEGKFLCGAHHYLVAGQLEGRLPKHDLRVALEVRLPGVTAPNLRSRVDILAAQTEPMHSRTSIGVPKTLWITVPRVNPDITFGGYRALFELMVAVDRLTNERGIRLALLMTEESQPNLHYFVHRLQDSRFRTLFSQIETHSRHDAKPFLFSPRDRFLCYSAWDALLVSPLAKQTDEPRVISLVQEYEPIFHDHSSFRALCDSGFNVPSYPVFNSDLLRTYFAKNGLGIFKHNPSARAQIDYAVFEQPITTLAAPTLGELRSRKDRTIAFYARAESHAARNLYEIGELALREICSYRLLDRRWSIIGLGSLSELPPIKLGGGHFLEFTSKLPENRYAEIMKTVDIGISLMYAPHPGLVTYEFASAAALAITNTFENRTASYLIGRSGNIIPCDPTVDGVVAALRQGLDRVEHFEDRLRDAYRPQLSWATTFSQEFVSSTIGTLL